MGLELNFVLKHIILDSLWKWLEQIIDFKTRPKVT
jgi:hypothetical protein